MVQIPTEVLVAVGVFAATFCTVVSGALIKLAWDVGVIKGSWGVRLKTCERQGESQRNISNDHTIRIGNLETQK